MDSTDQKNSICHVQPIQMYQLPSIDDDVDETTLPFSLLAGEGVTNRGSSNDGLIVLTNYRLYLQIGENHHHIPLGLIEVVEHKDLFYIHVGCKDARTYRCTFENNEVCMEWFDRILKASEPPRQLEQTFAFYYYIWSKMKGMHKNDVRNYSFDQKLFEQERERLGFEGDLWRISEANINYKLCPTYPKYLIVPSCISDEILECVAKFRSSRRIPAVVWRHQYNGAVIARCSQPEVGWLGWRSAEDEDLLKAISEACNFDLYLKQQYNKQYQLQQLKQYNSLCENVENDLPTTTATAQTSTTITQTTGINNANLSSTNSITTTTTTTNVTNSKGLILEQINLSTSPPNSINSDNEFHITNVCLNTNDTKEKKVLIMDARSYTTAVANRARGGGCECPEYYPNCEIQFMNLANIHSIRKSFHSLRLLCTTSAEQPNWFSQLENTRWLQHMSGLMKAAVTLVNAIEREARPVLVHCSDGWDRTPQIVALAELLLDPYYRTIDGFRILIEREWLAFGHKFADRCGHSNGSDDQNERCPVFLQWLDCVHQLLVQFSCAFEFSQSYLVKLAQHIYSNLYGTFLCNTFQDRMKIVNDKTFSVWEFLNSSRFRNHLYAPPDNNSCGNRVLWPQCNVRDLQLWNEVYLGKWETNSNIDNSNCGINIGIGGFCCPGPPIITTTTTTTTLPLNLENNTIMKPTKNLLNGLNLINNTEIVKNLEINKIPQTNPINISQTTINKEQQQLQKHEQINDDKQQFISSFTKTRSFSDLSVDKIHCDGNNLTRHCSDPNINIDNNKIGSGDFLCNNTLIEEKTECNNDCIYRNNNEEELINNDYEDDDDVIDVDGDDFIHNNKEKLIKTTNTFNNHINKVNGIGDDNVDGDDDGEDDLTDNTTHCVINGISINNKTDCCYVIDKKCNNETFIHDDDDKELKKIKSNNSCIYDKLNGINKQQQHLLNSENNHKLLIDGKTNHSVETSTDTLVSENFVCGSSPKDINGFEKLQTPNNSVESGLITSNYLNDVDDDDDDSIIQNNIKNVNSTNNEKYCINKNLENKGTLTTQLKTTVTTTIATSSSSLPSLTKNKIHCDNNGWENCINNLTLQQQNHQQKIKTFQLRYCLGDDGLIPVRSVAQERLWQILQEHKRKEDALEKELHIVREKYLKNVCHKCSHNNHIEKMDDAFNRYDVIEDKSKSCSPQRILSSPDEMVSTVESISSTGEGQASVVESSRSDMSWEALEENPMYPEIHSTLWVPDHAVNKCTGCNTEFWVGKRKHHCRKCGRIFCADCSRNSTPLPSEHLYNPVRVCTGCYSKLRRDCGELMVNQCKNTNNGHQPPTNTNPQITASSN